MDHCGKLLISGTFTPLRIFSLFFFLRVNLNGWIDLFRFASAAFRTPNRNPSLVMVVLAARDLLAMDSGGTSDPYCKIAFNEEEVKTQTIMKTVNPMWNETFVL